MAVSKYIQIDGTEYPVALTNMQRKGDVLDLTANRNEKGELKRDVIGTYYNYTVTFISPSNPVLYERLWAKLTEPKAFHMIQLPYQTSAFKGYFGSVQDDIKIVEDNGRYIGSGISCNIVASVPSIRATNHGN